MSRLFCEDTVFVSNHSSKEALFREISQKLEAKKLVKPAFVDHVIEREKSYPTALPLKPINLELPDIAIPHTESEYVLETRIVPVKLRQPIVFHNMISPDEEISVSFLFMILNKDEVEQAGLLAKIMDFINRQTVEELKDFFAMENPTDIYHYLEERFDAI